MSGSSKRTVTRWAAGLVAAASVIGTLGVTLLDGGLPAGAAPPAAPAPARAVAPAPQPTMPDLDLLLETADYVSDDGSYVRVADVEISAASVVRG